MFFNDHTTPFEQQTGAVSAESLLNRYIAAKPVLLGPEGLGCAIPGMSIAVGNTVYELLVSLSPSPSETSPDSLDWEQWTVVDRLLDSGGGGFYEGQDVPLTWAGMIRSLCDFFELDPNIVWDTGIDLKAYWADTAGEDEYHLPLEADAPRYALKTLYGPLPT